jgi:hypothetical protein
MNAVVEQRMIITEAGRNFNIPDRTLRRWLVLKNINKCQLGPSSSLRPEVETKLVMDIGKLQAAGFAPSSKTVQTLACDIATHFSIKTKFNAEQQSAGHDWYSSSMECNPCLSLRNPKASLMLEPKEWTGWM